MPESLIGESVLITGAARGLGLGVVNACVEAGGSVVVFDVDGAAVENVLHSVPPERAVGWVGDVASPADCVRAIDEGLRAFGSLTGLVNNAAILDEASVLDATDQSWARTLDVNLGGAWHATRTALPHLIRSGRGSIVNVASIDALIGQAGHAAYAASKAGLLALTRVVAAEHGADGIRCNAVCPGTMSTPMLEDVLASRTDPERVRAEMSSKIPRGRAADVAEVAAVIVFLLGPGSSYMNGTHVVVDGGRLAAPS